jgi:hypothetical protein
LSKYQPGDFVKVEFLDEATRVGEWMWVGFVQEVGTVSLNRYHEGLENIPGRVLGALGRNILRFTKTTYAGMTRTITIQTDEAMRYPNTFR